MARKIEGLLVALGFALVRCGGQAVTDRAAPDGSATTPADSGGSADADVCDDAGASQAEAGCGGAGGEQTLTADGRLRSACNLNVNRRGPPVAICFHIK